MEKVEKDVLRILKSHKGRYNPITAKAISKGLRVPEREIRRIISRLVIKNKLLIASSVNKPFGFYIIENLEELKGCLRQYYSRLKALKERASSLYKAGLKKFSKQIQGEFKFHDKSLRKRRNGK